MKSIISIAALVASSLSGPALAQEPPQRAEIVHYADLDLGTASGRAVLDQRVRAAVKAACGTASDADPEGKNEVRRCRVATRAQADRQRAMAIAAAEKAFRVDYSQR